MQSMKTLLISPGFGAGWSTWSHDPEQTRFMLTHEGLTTALMAGEDIGDPDAPAPDSPLGQFVADFRERFGDDDVPYLGGADDLTVRLIGEGVHFRVTEYDGSEGVELRDAIPWINSSDL